MIQDILLGMLMIVVSVAALALIAIILWFAWVAITRINTHIWVRWHTRLEVHNTVRDDGTGPDPKEIQVISHALSKGCRPHMFLLGPWTVVVLKPDVKRKTRQKP